MDMELGEIRMEEDDDAAGSFRNGAEIDDVGKVKSKESGKHKSKDKKKGRHEDRDGKRREKEASAEREYKELSGRDSERYDPRDNGRYESSRADYNTEKEQRKEKNRDKERNREKYREKDSDWEKTRDKERDKDKGNYRDRERELSIDRDRDRGRDRGKDRRKEGDSEKEKDVAREDERSKERDHDRGKAHEKDRMMNLERERREKDQDKKNDKEREKEKDGDRLKDRERTKEKSNDFSMERDRYKEKDRVRDKEDKGKDKSREKERESTEKDHDHSRARDRGRDTENAKDSEKSDKKKTASVDDGVTKMKREKSPEDKDFCVKDDIEDHQTVKLAGSSLTSDLQARVLKMKEERTKKKSDSSSEISAWVSKSRKLEEKKVSDREARRFRKRIDEQENMLEDSENEEDAHGQKDLAGVKILHGLDKVIEGGAVVLTLKDQDIIVDGDVNEGADMLENVEIGEQKNRDELYKAAKKKSGVYDDKFNDDVGSQRKILPQYDDPIEDEGVELDESGQFTGESERKLEELRKRIEGSSVQRSFEDLSASLRVSSDYYTTDEMVQFKKPKKKKSLRKKATLDLDALEAEALSAGLGVTDRGSRKDVTRQTAKEEQEKAEAKMRIDAYQTAYAKAEEASKVLRHEQTLTVKSTEDEDLVFGDDYEDLQSSLEQARKLALRKQDEAAMSGPQAVALLATANKEQDSSQIESSGEQEHKVVITEMEEFVLGLQFNEETAKHETEDVFMDVDDVPQSSEPEMKDEVNEFAESKEVGSSGVAENEEKVEELTPDEIIHEVPVGKGLAGALNLLKDRGVLKETIDWGGRNMDKKKSKLVGLNDNDGPKEIRIERTDEFGRIMTPKEAFRMLSHKFHGKGPGKMKQEKRMKQYEEDLKAKQMKSSDTPLLSMQKMREAQAQLQTPYLVLSGHVKPGQTSDPRSGFATVEKDHLGSLTPMLGDKKVEHFLGIRRRPESGNSGLPPLPKKPKS